MVQTDTGTNNDITETLTTSNSTSDCKGYWHYVNHTYNKISTSIKELQKRIDDMLSVNKDYYIPKSINKISVLKTNKTPYNIRNKLPIKHRQIDF